MSREKLANVAFRVADIQKNIRRNSGGSFGPRNMPVGTQDLHRVYEVLEDLLIALESE